jgi:hypothetical protein
MIHPIIIFINFSSQARWVKVDRAILPRKQRIKLSVQHANDLTAFVANDRVCLFVPKDRDTESSLVARRIYKVKVSHFLHIVVPWVGPGELSRKFFICCWEMPSLILMSLDPQIEREIGAKPVARDKCG